MYHLVNHSKYRAILCLNGELPPKTFFDTKLPIIAADGAANTLMMIGIFPTMVVGDLDSLHENYRAILPTTHLPDQRMSDFQKAMEYLKVNSLLPCLITGISGGYIDHILQNINIFLNGKNVFYAPPVISFSIPPGQSSTLSVKRGMKVSLLGIPSARVTTQGFKWELNETLLTFPGESSCFNRTIENEITLHHHKDTGGLLVMIYDEMIEDAGLHN
ncbi:thiamine diphosphokinase [Gammaproteobacteria bacterium]|nr:thiamine diphosphokinase [Gammaproteobacteria bacterium]